MSDMESRFEDALQAYEQGDYPLALETFRQLAAVQPYASEIQLNLGNVHFRLQEYEAAEACFRKAIELDPMEANAYLNLGNLLFKQERVEEAVVQWEVYKKLNKRNANVWLNLGIAYDQLGDMLNAQENYSIYLGLEPSSPEANRLKLRFDGVRKMFEHNVKVAEGLLARGRRAEAREALEKALAAYPGTAKLYKTYANLLYQEQNYREARVFYEKAYGLKPDDAAVLINLGVVFEKLHQPIQAIWAYHQAKSIAAPEQARVNQRFENLLQIHRASLPEGLSQAQVLMRQGKLKQAETLMNRMLALADYLPDAVRQELHEWLDKAQEAQDPMHKAVKTYMAKGIDAENNGQFDQALAYYQKLLAVRASGPQAEDARRRVDRIKTVMAAVVNSLLDQGEA